MAVDGRFIKDGTIKLQDLNQEVLDAIAAGGGGAVSTPIERDAFIEVPLIKTYPLVLFAIYAFTINTIKFKTTSGSVIFSVKIDGVTVTGLSNLVASSTQGSATATAANSVAIGQRVDLVVTAITSPQDLILSLGGTR